MSIIQLQVVLNSLLTSRVIRICTNVFICLFRFVLFHDFCSCFFNIRSHLQCYRLVTFICIFYEYIYRFCYIEAILHALSVLFFHFKNTLTRRSALCRTTFIYSLYRKYNNSKNTFCLLDETSRSFVHAIRCASMSHCVLW